MFLSGRKSSGPRRRDRTAQRSNKARIFRVAPKRSARGRLFPRNYEQLGGLGLVQAGTHSMADRYTYIPLIGLFIIIAWGIPELLGWLHYRKIILCKLN